jgi:hypothetical protein
MDFGTTPATPANKHREQQQNHAYTKHKNYPQIFAIGEREIARQEARRRRRGRQSKR